MSVGELPDQVTWTPGSEIEANKCIQIYGEYVKKRKTVTQLAVEQLETSHHIKRRIKWAALALREEIGDSEVVKQMADTALIDHIRKMDLLIEEHEQALKHRKKLIDNYEKLVKKVFAKNPNAKPEDLPAAPKLVKLDTMRDYTGLLREKRLALMDLARIRGVLDLRGSGGKGGNINIIMPEGLHRGQGVENVVEVVKPEKLKEIEQ